MNDNDTKRLSRLTAILTQLQTKRLLTATELAKKYAVSVRTIYRDIKALEEAGVPILTEEGKGYSLMEGYRIPPVMFTEREANALITAEQLVRRNKDVSFIQDYTSAVSKIKSVLRYNTQDKANLLASRIFVWFNADTTRSDYLSALQLALTNYELVKIEYMTADRPEVTARIIEPFALYHTMDNWIVIAWCRLRNDYREFRLDRIRKLTNTTEHFEPHTMTLEEYYVRYKK